MECLPCLTNWLVVPLVKGAKCKSDTTFGSVRFGYLFKESSGSHLFTLAKYMVNTYSDLGTLDMIGTCLWDSIRDLRYIMSYNHLI